MVLSIFLAAGAFVVAMAALFYDFSERRFQFALRAEESFADPVGRLVLSLSLALLVLSIGKAVGDSWTRERAIAEAEHERERIRTGFGDPELIVIAEFPAAALRKQAQVHPELNAKLNQLFALIKETPIPPDDCAGLQLAKGGGAVPMVGDEEMVERTVQRAEEGAAIGSIVRIGKSPDGRIKASICPAIVAGQHYKI